jgi:hypothetical protein
LHWLSYSHADQALLRDPDLEETWNALVVPGTLATFYLAGTGGFVLARGRPYLIDPRTPLLQTIEVSRPEPKKSHLTLAAIHDPAIAAFWPEREISLDFWQDGRWPAVVERVITFQEGYSSNASEKIEKYANLLEEATGRKLAASPAPPHRVVPPYWAVAGVGDPWWRLSQEAIAIALSVCEPARVTPILALTKDAPIDRFVELLGDLPDDCESVFCWRGSWDESTADAADITGWYEVAVHGHGYGLEVRNLYGGYLSVLLMGIGLDGLNHGIGYSEQRDTRRLGATGAPPTRYYVPALRCFVSRANAQPVMDALPTNWACNCSVCEGVKQNGIPLVESLTVDDLKRHFLICRYREIRRVQADLAEELERLRDVAAWLLAHSLPGVMPAGIGTRLALWATTIADLS